MLDEFLAFARPPAFDVHHEDVVSIDEAGLLIGVVSSIDIVRWLAANDGFTATRG